MWSLGGGIKVFKKRGRSRGEVEVNLYSESICAVKGYAVHVSLLEKLA